ncbi:hypothetical protein [Propionivibrio dicarboxylicus]|nr:hypothetical protein [Propionivibrio dicarboxylicus]
MLIDYLAYRLDHFSSIALILAWEYLVRRLRRSHSRLAWFAAIGTVAHETLHAGIGYVLGAQPESMRIQPHQNILGYVRFARLSKWNAAPVALAPLLLMAAGVWCFLHLMLPAFSGGAYLRWALVGWLSAICIFSGLPSTSDFRIAAWSIRPYCLAALVLAAPTLLFWAPVP